MNMDIEEYAKHVHFHQTIVPDWVCDHLKQNTNLSLIDLGCGDGAILAELTRTGLLKNHSPVAIDASQTRISRVKELLPNIDSQIGDVTCLSGMRDGIFDYVMSHQVIEHVNDDQEMLNEAYRILKPGGYLYLSTVFKKWYGWYFYRNQGHWRLDPTHLREYESDEELLPKFKNSGFEILRFKKTLFRYSVSDFVLKRLGAQQRVYDNQVLNWVRKFQIPIIGYYNWEIEARKNA